MIGADGKAVLQSDPIRRAAVATFSVTPRTDPQQDRQSAFLAQLHKATKISSAREIPNPLFFLMVDPKYIGGNNGNPTCLHFAKLSLPIISRISRIMKLPRNGKNRCSVEANAAVGDIDRISKGISPRKGQLLPLAFSKRQYKLFHLLFSFLIARNNFLKLQSLKSFLYPNTKKQKSQPFALKILFFITVCIIHLFS